MEPNVGVAGQVVGGAEPSKALRLGGVPLLRGLLQQALLGQTGHEQVLSAEKGDQEKPGERILAQGRGRIG